jgi:hypothetical protein
MHKPTFNKLSIVLILFLIVGCSKIDKVYEWQQSKDETRNLRYKYLGDNKFIFLDQYVKNDIKENNIIDNFPNCRFFNEQNWTCEGDIGKGKIVMLDGNIVWYHWGEKRQYKISIANSFSQTFNLD